MKPQRNNASYDDKNVKKVKKQSKKVCAFCEDKNLKVSDRFFSSMKL